MGATPFWNNGGLGQRTQRIVLTRRQAQVGNEGQRRVEQQRDNGLRQEGVPSFPPLVCHKPVVAPSDSRKANVCRSLAGTDSTKCILDTFSSTNPLAR